MESDPNGSQSWHFMSANPKNSFTLNKRVTPENTSASDVNLISGVEESRQLFKYALENNAHEKDSVGSRFLFITANENERKAFLSTGSFKKSSVKYSKKALEITLGILGKYPVAHVMLSKQGSIETATALSQLINELNPLAVIMVGIAFGVKETEQNISDVLVARSVIDYEYVKINTKYAIVPKGDIPTSGHVLYNAFNINDWKHGDSKKHRGRMLSGSKLVDNKKFKAKLISTFGDAIGGEMEGVGLASACSAHQLEWIVVKGISDFPSNKEISEKDANQLAAATAAMSLCAYVFSKDGIFKGLIPKSNGNINSSANKVEGGKAAEGKEQNENNQDGSALSKYLHPINNEDLLDAFHKIYWPLSQKTLYKDYIDCSTRPKGHIVNVVETIFDLVKSFSKKGCKLDDIEWYILICATVLHHSPIHEKSDFESNNDLQKYILLVKQNCECNCKRKGIECKCSFIDVPPEVTWNGRVIRLQFLTAILRLCNALDCSYRRLNIGETNTIAKLTNDIAFHWYSYYYTNTVGVDNGRITVRFRKPNLAGSDAVKYYDYIMQIVQKDIESNVNATSDILRDNGIYIDRYITTTLNENNNVRTLPQNAMKYINGKLGEPGIAIKLEKEVVERVEKERFINILHLSDTFFGIENYYNDETSRVIVSENISVREILTAEEFKQERTARLDFLASELSEWLSSNLAAEDNNKIDFLVISGNIVTRAETNEYDIFMKWVMEKLMPKINEHNAHDSSLPKEHIILCPGVTDFSANDQFKSYLKMCNDLGITALTPIRRDESGLSSSDSYLCGYRTFPHIAKTPITFIVFNSVSKRNNGKAKLDDENIILAADNLCRQEGLHEGLVLSVFHDAIRNIVDFSPAEKAGGLRKKRLERFSSTIIHSRDSGHDFLEVDQLIPNFNGGIILDGRDDIDSQFNLIRIDTDAYKYWGIVATYVELEWVIKFDEKTPKNKGIEFKHAVKRRTKTGIVADSDDEAKVAVLIDKVILGTEIEQDNQLELSEKKKPSLKEKEKSPFRNSETPR